MMVFGGETFYGLSNEVFALDTSVVGAEHWSLLSPLASSPDPRTGAAVVYDEAQNQLLVASGLGFNGLVSDTWSLDLSNTTDAAWTELSPTGDIGEGRMFSASGFDPVNRALLMFGGETYYDTTSTALCLDMSTMAWSTATLSGDTLPALTEASVVWADDRGGFILFGGVGYYTMYETAWFIEPTSACNLTVTELVGAGTSPGALRGPAMTYVGADSAAYLIGGQGYYSLSDQTSTLTP